MTSSSNRDLNDIMVILREVRFMQRRNPVTGAQRRIYNTLGRAGSIAARLERKRMAAS